MLLTLFNHLADFIKGLKSALFYAMFNVILTKKQREGHNNMVK